MFETPQAVSHSSLYDQMPISVYSVGVHREGSVFTGVTPVGQNLPFGRDTSFSQPIEEYMSMHVLDVQSSTYAGFRRFGQWSLPLQPIS